MFSQSYYSFTVDGTSCQGTVPAEPGRFNTGTSEIGARVFDDGLIRFEGLGTSTEDSSIFGSINLAGGQLALADFGSMQVSDYATSGTMSILANGLGSLGVQGGAGDTVVVHIKDVPDVAESGFETFHARVESSMTTFSLFDTPAITLAGVGADAGFSFAQAQYYVQSGGETVSASHFGTFALRPQSYYQTGSAVLHASDIGMLYFGTAPGVSETLTARDVGTIALVGQSSLSFDDIQVSTLKMYTPDATLITGSFTLHGGSEFLSLLQANGGTTENTALDFDLRQSVFTSGGQFNGVTIRLSEGNVATASGEDAVFRLGAANVNITISAAPGVTHTGRTEFIGGSSTYGNLIQGGAFGSDVVFGTGSDFVTGGTGDNTYTLEASAYGTSTYDRINDFKVGTDLLSLSRSGEASATILQTLQGDVLAFGQHEILFQGIDNFTLGDVHWT